MAVIKTTNPKVSTLKQGIKYITNPEKAELITGKDCAAETALEEMQATKALYNKTKGRQYMHFVQSFKPDDPLNPSQAHQIGLEMAEKHFKGYEVLVATHTDKDHLHNHLIVNSVSFETGVKFQHSKNDLKAIKELSDQICEREGLHVIQEKIRGRDLGRNEYQVAIKGESWKFKTMADIDKAIERTQSKEEFVKEMEAQGYKVNWTDTRKHITYTTPEGHKVRDNKLHHPNYLKEAMENGYRETQELKLQLGGTRSADELNLNRAGIENEGITGRTDYHEQPGHRGQSQPDHETGGEREGTESPNQGNKRTRHDLKQEAGRIPATELSEAGEGFTDHQRGSEKEPRNQQQNNSRGHGSSAPDQDHSQPELEGTGEAIRDTTSDNSGTGDRTARSVPTGNSLNDAIKALGSSFEKVQQEEKLKAELMKEKLEMQASQKEEKSELMKEKMEMKASQKTRSKGRDWGPDL
jgi:hypothetical protein